jgi:hypothetical protein
MNTLLFTVFLVVACFALLRARWDWWRNSPLSHPETVVGKILGRVTVLSPRNIFRRVVLLAVASPFLLSFFLLAPALLLLYIFAIIVVAAREAFRVVTGTQGRGELEGYAAELLMLVGALGFFRGIFIVLLQGAMRIIPAPVYIEYLEPKIGLHAMPLMLWHPKFSRADIVVGAAGFIIVFFSLTRDYFRRTWQIRRIENLPVASTAASAIGLSQLKGIVQPAGDCEGPVLRYESQPFCWAGTGTDDGFARFLTFYLDGKAGRILIDPTVFRPRRNPLSRVLDTSGPQEIVLTRNEIIDDDDGLISQELYPGDPLYVLGRVEILRDAGTDSKDQRTRVVRAAPGMSYRESLWRFFFGRRSLDRVFFLSDTGETCASGKMRRSRSIVLLLGTLWLCLCILVFCSGANGGEQWRRHILFWGGHSPFLKEASIPQSYYHFINRTYGGKMPDEANPSKWLRKLKDPHPRERIRALDALAGFPGKSDIIFPEVLPLAEDTDPLVSEAAWRCLQGIHAASPEALAFYRSRLGQEHFPYRVSRVMARVGPSAVQFVPDLVRIMKDPQEDALRKRLAVDALAAIGPGAGDALQDLVLMMKAKDKRERFAAYRAVVRILAGSPSAVPYLLRILENELWDLMSSNDLNMRREIFEALGEIGPPAAPAVPYLVGVLGPDRGYEEQVLVCRTLGRIGPAAKDALPVLEKSSKGPLEREARDAIRKITEKGK